MVSRYDRRALDDDYRLFALWHIVTPVFKPAPNIPTVIWWNHSSASTWPSKTWAAANCSSESLIQAVQI